MEQNNKIMERKREWGGEFSIIGNLHNVTRIENI
jgi:hypothetical protein